MLEGLVLGTSHLFYATRADLLRRPERNDEAADACGADGTVTNPACAASTLRRALLQNLPAVRSYTSNSKNQSGKAA